MTTTQTTYYIATDSRRSSIWGIGTSEQSALADAAQWVNDGDMGDIEAVEATEQLYSRVQAEGFDGAHPSFRWTVVAGVADVLE